MNKSIFKYFILLPIIILAFGCNHDTDTFDGPNIIDRFGPLEVIENISSSKSSVDFAAGESVYFTAIFNKNINWQVKITGTESGAVKIIDGFDSELNAENSTWRGGTTQLPFFKAELCTVELIIPEEPTFTGSTEVETLSTKTYEGSLFTDFETNLGSDLFLGNFEFELTNKTGRQNDIPAAQGDYYYLFEGNDNVVSNFFVGLVNISAKVTGANYVTLPTTVPEDLYFNCFLYSDGTPYTIAVIQFVFDSNNSGAFEDGQDQTFQIEGDFPIQWEGWRQISHSMADVGMSEEQLQKLVTIRVLLISDKNSQPNPSQEVRFGIDYLTFTKNGPLEL
jgi:hypothetical protein